MDTLNQYPVVVLNGKRLIAKRESEAEEKLFGYALIDPENMGGISYAHVRNGMVKRLQKIIANESDLVETEEIAHVSDDHLFAGILRMMSL